MWHNGNNIIFSLSRFLVSNNPSVTRCSAAANFLPLLQSKKSIHNNAPNQIRIQFPQYAARKGTRTRKEKKKVKKEEVKRVFVFDQLKKQASLVYQQQRIVENAKTPDAVDDVFFNEKFRSVSYSFADAVQNHKDIHHPTMYNIPNAPLILRLDIDLVYPNRPNKFQEAWRNIVEMRAPFLLEGMVLPTVLAFCPSNDNDIITEAIKAGADVAGSNEIIKSIQEGHIDPEDFEYIVSHPSMVTDLTVIRGLIKKKFPTIKAKTINMDIPGAIRRLKSGIQIKLVKNDREPDFGYLETPIGKLDMDIAELESNFEAVFFDTAARRVAGKAPENFIIRCALTTPHTAENLKIDISPYITRVEDNRRKHVSKEKEVEEKEDKDEEEAVTDSPTPAAVAQ